MKIIIHIGWHKTGTSSIQAFLKNNSIKLIHENKFYYPNEGLASCAHHHIAWAIKGQDKSPWGEIESVNESIVIEQAIESANNQGCHTIIFSSEEFCTFSEKDIVKLYKILTKMAYKIIIIAYVRRQDLLIESSYNMEVKWWGSRLTDSFQQYVNSKTPFHKYDEVLDTWANVFGLDNIKVRLYDSADLPKQDVRLDLCVVAGIDSGNLLFDNKRINSSLGYKGLAILKVLNKFYMPKILHMLTVRIIQSLEKPSKCVLFTPEQRIEFMQSLNNSNRNLEKFSVNPDSLILEKDNVKDKNHIQL